MKTIFLKVNICLATLFTNFNSIGQDEEEKPLKNSLNLMYSPAMNILGMNPSSSTADGNKYLSSSHNSIGVIGFHFDHQMTPRFLLGVDLFYNSTSSRGDLVNNFSGEVKSANYTNSRLRVMTRFSRTIVTNIPNFEMYFGGGIGFNQRFRNFYVENVRQPSSSSPSYFSIPICMRMYYGMRYTIYKNFGLTGEFGLGGPLITAGLSYKF